MPVYEYSCGTAGCSQVEHVIEMYVSRITSEVPTCKVCQSPMTKLVSRFHATWCRSLDYYNDKSKDNASSDGHWGWNRDGSKEWITTRQQQKAFVKKNGFVDPVDLPSTAKISPGNTIQGKLTTDKISEI